MTHRHFITLIIIVIMCLFSAEIANSGWINRPRKRFFKDRKRQTQHIEDIQYSDKNIRCKLDIYKKNTPDIKKPIILFVHGGGWKRGDKSAHAKKGDFFADNDFIFIAMNYPLFPYAGYRAQANNVAQAIAWIYKNAEQYSGNKDAIILMGHSAGGHLVALVSTDDTYLKSVNLGLNNIKETILLDSAGLDILSIKRNYPGAFKIIYNPIFGNDTKVLKNASPISHVQDNKDYPTFLIFYSTLNEKISRPSIDFFKRTSKRNLKSRIYGINANHFAINNRIGDRNDKITQIILEHLKGSLSQK